MIHVVATLRVDPAQREAFLAIFAELAPTVLAEAGCIEYGATIDSTPSIEAQTNVGNDAVVVIEKWESTAALEAHLTAPHMDAFREKTSDMLRGATINVLSPA